MGNQVIHVGVVGSSTVARPVAPRAKKNDTITFKNGGASVLTVSINGATASSSPLGKSGHPVPNVRVSARKSETLDVLVQGQLVTYTAIIGNNSPDSPIIIID